MVRDSECIKRLREPVFPHHILEKIMVEHLRYPSQQIDVDAWAVEDGVHVGPLAVDLPRELRYAHLLLVKHRLDQVTDMKFLVHALTCARLCKDKVYCINLLSKIVINIYIKRNKESRLFYYKS